MELQNFINDNLDYIDVMKQNNFKVIKYRDLILIKNKINNEIYSNQDYWKMYCNGAIIDTKFNKIVCLPPVKSILLEEKNIQDLDITNSEIQYLIDGTMINLFYYDNKWNLSTRSGIGGYNKWNNKKSFKTMFDECVKDISFNYDILEKNCSYTFIMKHIENRNISSIDYNDLFLVEMYRYTDDKIERVLKKDYPKDINTFKNCETIQLPFKNYDFKGYTIKTNNHRYKITNPIYEDIKNLKLNYNNDLICYLELRKNGNLKKYLQHFPEKKKDFLDYKEKLHSLSNNLYSVYKNIYVYKNDIKPPYYLKPFLIEIHSKYIKTQKPISWTDIKQYIHNLESKRIAFSLNYMK
jgi:hypothetical protein